MFQHFLRKRFGKKRVEIDSNAGNGRGRGHSASQGQGGSKGGFGGGMGSGGGKRGGNKPGSGPGGNCLRPKCGHKEPHVAGQRCTEQVCLECGSKMIRE